MASTILHKRSQSSGVTPTAQILNAGELAMNTVDGKLFIKADNGSIKTFSNDEYAAYNLDANLSAVSVQHGNNSITQVFGSVLQGHNNSVSGAGSTIVNGENNSVAADFGLIGGGINNSANSDSDYGAILGGRNNTLNHQESFIIGSNITSHASNFTYVNNFSATGKIYGDGSSLSGIVAGDTEATTLVRTSSASWGTGGVAQNLSFNENNNELSISFGNTISLSSLSNGSGEYLPLSGGTVNGSITANDITTTGKYYGDGSSLTGIIAGDIEATTLVRANSADWNYQGTDIKSLSSNWQTTYSYVSSTSANLVLTSDSRLSDSRTPTGNAGGDLTGTYPNPTIKNSIALAGTPTAPTAAAGTNTTQIATTEYVLANGGDRYLTTSNTSNVIDNSNGKTFVVASSGLAYTPTQDVTIVSNSDPLNYHMHCTVVSYSGYTLVVDTNSHSGNGTHTDWTINVGGYTAQAGVLLQSNNLSDVASASTSLTNLGGVSTSRTINAGLGLTGGGDLTVDRTISIVFGNTSNTAVSGNDPRLSDARTPLAHKTTHAIGGSDVLTPSDIGAVSNTTFNSVSGNWQSTYNTVSSLSANWQTTFQASSAYVYSNPTGITGASALRNMIQITQAGYNAITPASDTIYIIVG